jgi:hypothetical protein
VVCVFDVASDQHTRHIKYTYNRKLKTYVQNSLKLIPGNLPAIIKKNNNNYFNRAWRNKSVANPHDPQQTFYGTWLIEENNKTSQTVFTHYNEGNKKEDIENAQYTSLTF